MKRTPNLNLPLIELNDNVWNGLNAVAGEKTADDKSALQIIDDLVKAIQDKVGFVSVEAGKFIFSASTYLGGTTDNHALANKEYVNSLLATFNPDVDFSNYYTKSEVDSALANVTVDLSAYATTDYVNTQIGNIETILNAINSGNGGAV